MRADFVNVYSWLDLGLSTLYLDSLRTSGRGYHSPHFTEELQRGSVGALPWQGELGCAPESA